MPKVWGRFDFPISSRREANALIKEFHARRQRNEEYALQQGDEVTLLQHAEIDYLGQEYQLNGHQLNCGFWRSGIPPDPYLASPSFDDLKCFLPTVQRIRR